MHYLKCCLFLIGCLLLVGCMPSRSILEPEVMPREKIASAVLRTPTAVLREGEFRDQSDFIRIVTVDGEPTRTLDNRVVLSPGSHEIQIAIELRRPNEQNPALVDVTRSDTSLTFTAKPDAEYLLDAELNGLGLWVWVVEEFEGDVVAGRHPSGKSNLLPRRDILDSYDDEEAEEMSQ